MAGLLDALGSYSGDDTTKDQYGQTQADRRQPLWSGLLQAGMLGVAAGGNLMPADRANLIAQAAGAVGNIGPAMQQQQSNAAQRMLSGQQIQAGQQKLAAQAQMAAYAKTPEGQAAFANLDPAERSMLQMALAAGDMQHATAILTGTYKLQSQSARLDIAKKELDLKQQQAALKLGAPTMKDGDYVYANGNRWNDVSGWKVYNGAPVPFGQGHTIAPPPGQGSTAAPTTTAPTTPAATTSTGAAPTGPLFNTPPQVQAALATPGAGNPNPQPEAGASPNAPFPSLTRQFPQPAGQTTDQEIANWSNTPANAGIPYGLKPSELDDKPRNYAALATLDPAVAKQIQKIGDYKDTIGTVRQQLQNPDVKRYVEAYNPDFDIDRFKIIHDANEQQIPGKTVGNQIQSQITAYNHIQNLWKEYQLLGGPQTPTARATLQYLQRQRGLVGTSGFDVSRSAVADEVAKTMKGTSGPLNEAEQKDWGSKFDPTKSDQAMHAAVVASLDLLEGKERGIKSAYHDATGLQRKDFLPGDAKAFAQTIRAYQPQTALGQKPAATPTTPKPGQVPIPGKTTSDDKPLYQHSDGRVYTVPEE